MSTIRMLGSFGLFLTTCVLRIQCDEIIGFDGKDYEPAHPKHFVNHRHHVHRGHHHTLRWADRRALNAAKVRELSSGVRMNKAPELSHTDSDMVHLSAEKANQVQHAELCVKRANEDSRDDRCRNFMKAFCKPGAAGSQWPGQAYCSQFFEQKENAMAPPPPDTVPLSPASAPAPVMASSPAGAPCPDGLGLESNPLPEQGFHGTPVAHDNMKTSTDDWRSEYGPRTPTFKEICAKYPNSSWCKAHGYHTKPVKIRDGSQTWTLSVVTMLAVAAIHALSA